MASELERRRYPRARFAWRAAIGFRTAEELVDARTVDISLGGVCLHGPLMATPGDELVILMGLKDRIVPALATVVRADPFTELEEMLHLEFNWFADSGRDRLARLTWAV